MTLKIYNTLTGASEPFEPAAKDKTVRMYVCGPTVYDEPHIGHLRSAYVFEIARKVLKEKTGAVRFVRNVTDVDDKIIDRAREEKTSVDEVSRKYLEAYHRALERFGIEPLAENDEPRATACIPEMIALTERLVGAGKAYAAAGSVYFRVRAFADYGKLSRQKLDAMLENVRKEAGEGKEEPLDFALWKKSAPGEPAWDSPWGRGRPGWHIECSAMSLKRLGEEFDVHGGGRDLLFPHHENERAQSMAATGKRFARVWMHHGLVTIEGRKMSKSLGNFVSLAGIERRGFPLDALKLLFLQSHYRSDVDFTWDKMKSFETALRSFRIFFEKAGAAPADRPASSEERAGWDHYEKDLFWQPMETDFDTPLAVGMLNIALGHGNEALAKGSKREAQWRASWLLQKWSFLGLFGDYRADGHAVGWRAVLDKISGLREASRQAKRYTVSDLIRTELVKLGFEAEDTKGESRLIYTGRAPDSELENRLNELLKRAEAMK